MARVPGATKKPDEINPLSQSLSQSKRKAQKGTVVVQVFKDRLRLCWSYLGKRFFLYIGLPDSKVNCDVAEEKARKIEGDMATDNFDPTLKKYKLESQYKHTRISVAKLFELFMVEKAKEVTAKTMENYRATFGYLNRYYGNEAAEFVDHASAEKFAHHLIDKGLSPIPCKRRLEELEACWKWVVR